MRFRLALVPMTLDDLNLNFLGILRYLAFLAGNNG